MNADSLGLAFSGATAAALDTLDTATAQLRCYVGDPLALAQKATAQAPEMTMAHALVAWLNLLGTEPAGLAAAAEALAIARTLPATAREQAHLMAIEHLVHGRWHAASRVLEDLSIDHPLDLLALQAGHQVDFFTGHSRMLRDRIARALPAWSAAMPGYHAVMGMLAFGLEETAAYGEAEKAGRRAVELERRDGWAWHAVAHVMEMQNRRREGVAWLGQDVPAWNEGSFFAVHNAWHLALFHLGLGDTDQVLELADQRILGSQSPVVLDMVDASALLWRLALRGVDVGDRWQSLADRWSAVSERSHYAFNDLHAMMAFASCERDQDVAHLQQAQADALLQPNGDNVDFLRDVGLDATQAVLAFVRGEHADAVQRLRRVRPRAHRFGGSHAQRDLIDLTLIEAARLDGQQALMQALLNERKTRAACYP
jgi:tetratricopeptide (TPR) repeat protein